MIGEWIKINLFIINVWFIRKVKFRFRDWRMRRCLGSTKRRDEIAKQCIEELTDMGTPIVWCGYRSQGALDKMGCGSDGLLHLLELTNQIDPLEDSESIHDNSVQKIKSNKIVTIRIEKL